MSRTTKKIVTIIGARPQFIKAAAVSRVILKNNGLQEVCIHTGQHYDANMSEIFFEELQIPQPAYNLGISGGSHGAQTGRMLEAVEEVIIHEKPDLTLVYGDTNSTLAGALAAAKLHIPVAHVEAGLRSFNRQMPEEVNRILTDHCSQLLFAPTYAAAERLKFEGISEDAIRLSGDVMYDCTLYYAQKADQIKTIVTDLELRPKQYALVTIHRAENTDRPDRLSKIFDSLELLSNQLDLILPLHPRTRKALEALKYDFQNSPIRFINPVGYLEMMQLEKNAVAILTDSGGVQKEAFFHKVPCITLRKETEWTELLHGGWNRLCEPEDLIEAFGKCRTVDFESAGNPYGDGNSAALIVSSLEEYLKTNKPTDKAVSSA